MALLQILNGVYQSSDSKNVTLLAALDISAAFDTMDIPTIERWLEHSFGVTGVTLRWIKSYISYRAQFVKVDKARSLPETCSFRVPQGSVLGPLDVAPFANVTASCGVEFHQYADDNQLYIAFNQSDMMAKLCDVE